MKKIIFSLLFALSLIKVNAAVEYDLVKGVDFTAITNFSYSLLNQLVDNGKIAATNKGVVIRFSGGGGTRWPNVTDNPRYTNFLWLDVNTFPGTLKQYVPTGDSYTNWVISTVTPGSITTTEILNFTITDQDLGTNSISDFTIKSGAVGGTKLADNGIIAGKIGPAAVILGNFAFRAITGGDITNKTITATNIADNTIGPLQLANDAVINSTLTNGAVTTDKIAETNITRNLIRDDAIGSLQITNAAVTTNKLAGDINSGLLSTNVSHALPVMWGSISGAGSIFTGHGDFTITPGGTGRYRINFTTPFSTTNYCVLGGAFAANSAVTIFNTMSNTTSDVWVQLNDASAVFKAAHWYFTIYNY